MSIYYFSLDATGNAGGTSEANAYDGTSTVTLPDGASGVCTLRNVILELESGDKLRVKKSSTKIPWVGSETQATRSTDGPTDFVDGATKYGRVEIIGYGETFGDEIRPNVDMQSYTWRFNRRSGVIENINFIECTYGGEPIRIAKNATISKCGIYRESGNGACVGVTESGTVDRCEIVNPMNPITTGGYHYGITVYSDGPATVSNCYVQCSNGGHGIYVSRNGINRTSVCGNIINVNLDEDGAGNGVGDGIYVQDAGYNTFLLNNNIIIRANAGINLAKSNTDYRTYNAISDNIFALCAKAIDGHAAYNSPAFAGDTAGDEPPTSTNNIFYANTANSYLNQELNPTYLTSDPFVSVVNKDFSIKDASLSEFGNAKSFTQPGASGDTTTSNALVPLRRFTVTTSGSLSLASNQVGDVVTVSGKSFQKVSTNPIVWDTYSSSVDSVRGSWTPSEITTALWFDAAEIASLTLSGTAVTQWNDKSGNSRNATQGTISYRPVYSSSRQINNINVVDFDGVSDFMDLADYTSSAGLSVVAVFTPDDVGGGSSIYHGKNIITSYAGSFVRDFSMGVRDSALSVYAEDGTSNVEARSSTGITGGQTIIAYGQSNSTNTQVSIDGNSPGITGGSRNDLLISGIAFHSGAYYFDGGIAEIIIVDDALSDVNRKKLEGYLAHKWALASQLPSDHPYKIYAP